MTQNNQQQPQVPTQVLNTFGEFAKRFLVKFANIDPKEFTLSDFAEVENHLYQNVFASLRRKPSPAETLEFVVQAIQYNLNPFLKHIMFLERSERLLPYVATDGWYHIANNHEKSDGMEISFSEDSRQCTVTLYRKDWKHPVRVTEFLEECATQKSDTWLKYPRRMLRHRTIKEAIRIAFGVNIVDIENGDLLTNALSNNPAFVENVDYTNMFNVEQYDNPYSQHKPQQQPVVQQNNAVLNNEAFKQFCQTWGSRLKKLAQNGDPEFIAVYHQIAQGAVLYDGSDFNKYFTVFNEMYGIKLHELYKSNVKATLDDFNLPESTLEEQNQMLHDSDDLNAQSNTAMNNQEQGNTEPTLDNNQAQDLG